MFRLAQWNNAAKNHLSFFELRKCRWSIRLMFSTAPPHALCLIRIFDCFWQKIHKDKLWKGPAACASTLSCVSQSELRVDSCGAESITCFCSRVQISRGHNGGGRIDVLRPCHQLVITLQWMWLNGAICASAQSYSFVISMWEKTGMEMYNGIQ